MRKYIAVLMVIFLMFFSCACSDREKSKDTVEEATYSYKEQIPTENIAKDIEYEINIGEENFSLDSQINFEKLRGLDEKELGILRNAIYAKYGYIFKSLEYNKFFSEIQWYKPKFGDVNNMLTETDIKNIENIVEIEKVKSELEGQNSNQTPSLTIDTASNYDTQSSSDIVGMEPIPQKYIDFMKEKDNEYDIVFYVKEDIDLDGNDEVVIACGSSDGYYISSIYVLSENDGKIQQLGENLAEGGYGVCEIKLIGLQNMLKKYIYCGITNGAGMAGFKIYDLADNEPNVICYSASATGSGDDELKDFDNDGQFDGYIQNRSSYDVLYYSLSHTYVWEENGFILKHTHAEIPEYPDNIKDILIQYMTLRVLNNGKAPNIDKRLSELCIHDNANNIDFARDVWYTALSNTVMEIGNMVKWDIEENINTATATAVYVDDSYKKHTQTFHLIKLKNKWCIDNII